MQKKAFYVIPSFFGLACLLGQGSTAMSQEKGGTLMPTNPITVNRWVKTAQAKDKQKAALAREQLKKELHRVISELRKALKSGDQKRGLSIVRPMLPTVKIAKTALIENFTKDAALKLAAYYKETLPSDDAALARVLQFSSTYTKIIVHQASAQEIKDYTVGSVAWKHFPGGCKRLAKQILRPETLFYEVEFVKPGTENGVKYHLFYWSGATWTMLGPIWRLFR
jgi:hypothetical protein